MAKQKTPTFSAELLDHLLDGRDSTTVPQSDGLIGILSHGSHTKFLIPSRRKEAPITGRTQSRQSGDCRPGLVGYRHQDGPKPVRSDAQ